MQASYPTSTFWRPSPSSCGAAPTGLTTRPTMKMPASGPDSVPGASRRSDRFGFARNIQSVMDAPGRCSGADEAAVRQISWHTAPHRG